jgi:hypothetical protein
VGSVVCIRSFEGWPRRAMALSSLITGVASGCSRLAVRTAVRSTTAGGLVFCGIMERWLQGGPPEDRPGALAVQDPSGIVGHSQELPSGRTEAVRGRVLGYRWLGQHRCGRRHWGRRSDRWSGAIGAFGDASQFSRGGIDGLLALGGRGGDRLHRRLATQTRPTRA